MIFVQLSVVTLSLCLSVCLSAGEGDFSVKKQWADVVNASSSSTLVGPWQNEMKHGSSVYSTMLMMINRSIFIPYK